MKTLTNLNESKYVLFYRRKNEPMNTAHLILLAHFEEAKTFLNALNDVEWASLCNNNIEVRDSASLL